MTDYAILPPTERRGTYTGTVDDSPTTIVVRVSDTGEPGAGVDGFSISSPLYSVSGPTIARGNIQLHLPGGCASKPGRATRPSMTPWTERGDIPPRSARPPDGPAPARSTSSASPLR